MYVVPVLNTFTSSSNGYLQSLTVKKLVGRWVHLLDPLRGKTNMYPLTQSAARGNMQRTGQYKECPFEKRTKCANHGTALPLLTLNYGARFVASVHTTSST